MRCVLGDELERREKESVIGHDWSAPGRREIRGFLRIRWWTFVARCSKFSTTNSVFLPIALVFSALALFVPELLVSTRLAIPWLLGTIMFGMGMTLQPKDFIRVVQRSRLIMVGLVAQYTAMPLLALGISYVFDLPPELVFGGLHFAGGMPGRHGLECSDLSRSWECCALDLNDSGFDGFGAISESIDYVALGEPPDRDQRAGDDADDPYYRRAALRSRATVASV